MYEIGQTFSDMYPPEAGQWCNANGAHIEQTEAGYVIAANPLPSPEEGQAEFTARIQERLDAWARTRGYDGILSACTYATSTVAKFAAEGQAAVQARDATWNTAYDLLAQYQAAGTLPAWEDVEAHLPPLAWPQAEPETDL